MTDWGYWERRQRPRPLRIAATPDELGVLLRRSLPYLEWIGNQSPWPQPYGLVQEIYQAIGLAGEVEK